MDASFWLQRWQAGQIGFHLPVVNPLLTRFWNTLAVAEGTPVWVPLCGKSQDMAWLHDRGHPVIGVEISRTAIEGFDREQALKLHWQDMPPFSLATGDGYQLYCGDYFAVTRGMLEGVGAAYDRAALIAMPSSLRHEYADRFNRCLAPGWRLLLITLDYPQHQRAGPPFSVDDAEVRELFAGCAIELLGDEDVLPDHSHFAAQGVTVLRERVYAITDRG